MKQPVEVIGGGFSGLTVAYYLAKSGFAVTVREQRETLGGLISTEETPWGVAETAASGLMNSPLVESFFTELDLPMAKRSLHFHKKRIYRAGKLRRWPLSLLGSLRLFLGICKILCGGGRPKKQETIQSWGKRVLGQEGTDFLLCPALQGVYAGDPKRLSASLILQRFFRKEEKERGELKEGRGTVAPSGGMVVLINRLREKLKEMGVVFVLGEKVEITTDVPTVLAVPADGAASLLEGTDQEATRLLRELEYLPLATVTLFSEEGGENRGFGCLFPRGEGFSSLGVLFRDGLFLQDSPFVAERWILGGAENLQILEMSEEEIVELAKKDFTKLYGEEKKVLGWHVKKWSRALPHYSLGLENKLEGGLKVKFENLQKQKGIILFGNYTGALGLGQILSRAREIPKKIKDKE